MTSEPSRVGLHFGKHGQFASISLTFLDFPMMTIIYWYRLAGPANFAQIVAKPGGFRQSLWERWQMAASWPPTRFCRKFSIILGLD